MKNTILISHLDIIKEKNIRDIVFLSKLYGYEFHVFSYASHDQLPLIPDLQCYIYSHKLINRFFQYLSFAFKYRRRLDHTEIYTGCGNFWVLEAFICYIFGIKSIACERGTPLLKINKNSPAIRNIKIFALKYLVSKIWIRELWMGQQLQKLHIPSDKVYLIPNAIDLNTITLKRRSICGQKSFLWVNSFKEFRHLDWVYDSFKQLSQPGSNIMLTIAGDLSQKGNIPCPVNHKYAQKLKSVLNTSVLPFCEPYQFYLDHKFFILPADIVYLNNSLLEAMAYGCIPIISDVQGSRLIVPDSNYGILFSNDQQSFHQAILRALSMSDSEIKSMQINIRIHLDNNFSLKNKVQKLFQMYRDLN